VKNNSQTVTLACDSIDGVEEFTYLGSVVSTAGGTDQDVKAMDWEKLDQFYAYYGQIMELKIIGRSVKRERNLFLSPGQHLENRSGERNGHNRF